MKLILISEFMALEQAIATLEGLIQDIAFEDEIQASYVRKRLISSRNRLDGLIILCSPEDG